VDFLLQKFLNCNFKNVLSILSYQRDLPINGLWLVVMVGWLKMLFRFYK